MSPARTSDKAKKPLKLPVKKEQKSSKRLKSGSSSSTLNTREENLTVSSESWNGLKIVKVNKWLQLIHAHPICAIKIKFGN